MNKGFTLVELLVVMLILGIVTMMSLPLVRNLTDSSNKKEYEAYRKSLVSAGKLYVDSYSEDLFGRKEAACAYITYKDLSNKKLIKDINKDDLSCNTNYTFVKVTKVDKTYKYDAYMSCVAKGSNKITLVYPYRSDNRNLTPYTMKDSTTCNVNSENTITASIDNKSSSSRMVSVRIKLKAQAGINNSSGRVYYAWSYSNDPSSISASDWHLANFDYKTATEQKNDILNSGAYNATSSSLVSPSSATGVVYLYIKSDELYDLYGNRWTGDNNTNIAYVGKYSLDNTPPVITTLTVNKETNPGNVKGIADIAVRATDTGTGVNKITCSGIKSFNTDHGEDRIIRLGAHTIECFATDNAGNVGAKKKISFNLKGLGLDYNPDYNRFGTGYQYGARVQSFDLRIVSSDGRTLYQASNISDYCSRCTEGITEYGATYYFTNVKYRNFYGFDSISLRTDGANTTANNTGISVNIGGNGTSFSFKHNYNGDLFFSINTRPSCSKGYSWNYNFTSSPQEFDVICPGSYRLEAWGAEGSNTLNGVGGVGAYVAGTTYLNNGEKLFINVGGMNGYNGGGPGQAPGGGATHIATANRGNLANYQSSISSLLLVAGGGGGGERIRGGNGGTPNGGGGTITDRTYPYPATGATQSRGGTGYNGAAGYNASGNLNGTFGTGGSGLAADSGAGGGGGFYGGGATTYAGGGGGGSSYISGRLSSQNYSATRYGNGFAKITYLG